MDAAADLPPRTILLTRLNGKAAAREDRKRSDYRKRPMSRQRHYWLYRDTSLPLAVTMYDVFIRNAYTYTEGATPASSSQRRPVCVFLYTHGRWPEEYASRWRAWRAGRRLARVAARTRMEREGGKERKSCMHVRRTWSPCDRLTGVKVLLMAYPIHAERGI